MVQVDGPLGVVSGLRLGAEQLGAEAALALDLPLVVVLPYPEADKPWPAAARARFAELVDAAEVAITLETKMPATKQMAGAALGRRDAWLARQVDAAGGVGPGRRHRRPPRPLAGGPPSAPTRCCSCTPDASGYMPRRTRSSW